MIPGTPPMLALQHVDSTPSAEVRLAKLTPGRDEVLRRAERAISALQRWDASLRRLAAPPPARVLLVDDVPYVVELLKQEIERRTGCEVEVIADAERAMAEVTRGDYAAVVADLDLSHHGINGADIIAAARGLRMKALYSGAPIDLDEYKLDPDHVTVIKKAEPGDALARFCEKVRRLVHPSAPPSAPPSPVPGVNA